MGRTALSVSRSITVGPLTRRILGQTIDDLTAIQICVWALKRLRGVYVPQAGSHISFRKVILVSFAERSVPRRTDRLVRHRYLDIGPPQFAVKKARDFLCLTTKLRWSLARHRESPAYTAAKHGVVGLTQAASLEYGAQNIRINAVGPGFIHTAMVSKLEQDAAVNAMLVAAHPIGRLGRAEEVGELIAWLA